MSKIEQLEKRIAELEAEVTRLQASQQPTHVIHSHYHYGYPQPINVGVPLYPQYPYITYTQGGQGIGYGGSQTA